MHSIESQDFKSGGLGMANIGYARVSTNGQDLAVQQEALRAAACEKVYAEKISGARGDRPQLMPMLKALEPEDTIIVTRLDRLARSTLDLLHTVDVISKAGAGFRSLADAWADTTTPHGKPMLTVLGGLRVRAPPDHSQDAGGHCACQRARGDVLTAD
jgi:DNA invertase Pin-like site-specific DNA recombinase